MSNSWITAVIALSILMGLALIAGLLYLLYCRRMRQKSGDDGILEDQPGWLGRIARNFEGGESRRALSPLTSASTSQGLLSQQEAMKNACEEQSSLLQDPAHVVSHSHTLSLPPLTPNRYTVSESQPSSLDTRRLRFPRFFSPKSDSRVGFPLPLSAPPPSLQSGGVQHRAVLPVLFSRGTPTASRASRRDKELPTLPSHTESSRSSSDTDSRIPLIRQESFLSMSSERSISVTSLHTIPESRLELELAEDELSFPTFEISPTSMASPRYSWLPNIVQRNLPWRAPAGSVMSMPVPVLETPESSVQVRSLAALHSTPEMLEAEDEPPMSSGMIGFSGYTYLSSSTADYYSLSRPLPVPPTC